MSYPAPVIQKHEGILVVRDDLLPGGTKVRVLHNLMASHNIVRGLFGTHAQACDEYVYASPVYGYAQLALAHTAKALGKQATVFCAQRKERYHLTTEAERLGAKIVEIPGGYLTVVTARAREYCQKTGAVLLPFGLDTPEIVAAIAEVAGSLRVSPREVWSVAGSGTLTRGLQLAWPRARFFAVRTGAQPDAGRAEVLVAPEKFEQDAKHPPSFPSCKNYDAKAWQFIKVHASKGALFWNVAA